MYLACNVHVCKQLHVQCQIKTPTCYSPTGIHMAVIIEGDTSTGGVYDLQVHTDVYVSWNEFQLVPTR